MSERSRPSARERRLTADIRVRFEPQEKTQLKAQAELAGLTVSALARRFLLGRRVVSHQARLDRNELRRLGGLFKNSYTETKGVYAKETAEVIRLIEKLLRNLDEE